MQEAPEKLILEKCVDGEVTLREVYFGSPEKSIFSRIWRKIVFFFTHVEVEEW